MRYTIVISFLLFFTSVLNAQEIFLNLSTNAKIKNELNRNKAEKKKRNKTNSSVELPFFDDFSFSETFPSGSLWQDSAAFINKTYGVNPVTIGVATLDAINKLGDIHSNVVPNVTRLADTLTSKPVNLDYPGNMSVFLSFFYQPQGVGDAPQSTDTLVLEYFSPVSRKWSPVWKAVYYQPNMVKEIFLSSEEEWNPENSPADSFKQVILPVLGSDYLVDGFQFRFKNYVSITATIPSKIGNGDFWNIDYVLLDKDRNINDTIVGDVAFLNPTTSLLQDYEAMPWRHYVNKKEEVKMKEFIKINYKNNDNIRRTIDSLYITFSDTFDYTPVSKLEASASNIDPGVEMNPELPIGGYFFPTHTGKKAVFDIQVKLVTSSTNDPIENNKTNYYQNFYNYYAYDDGVPELGYGISGSGTKNAMVAYKFNSFMADTIRAVEMYFNRTYNDESRKYFDLTIWNDNNGQPGDIIYRELGHRPEYEGELNNFISYPISDTSNIVVNGTFYVGWIQTSEALLNIGYDLDRNAQDKIFYNINGSWQMSGREGALLIRPVFRKELLTSIKEPKTEELNIKVYPNPATEFIKIKFKSSPFDNTEVSIFNSLGQRVKFIQNYSSDNYINISELKRGIYILKINNESQTASKKILIQK